MPVYKLMEEMPYEEVLKWGIYFKKRPFGWREDDRTAKIMMAFGVKAKPEQLFASLGQMKKAEAEEAAAMQPGQISVGNLKNSALFSKLLGVTGGDKIQLLQDLQ